MLGSPAHPNSRGRALCTSDSLPAPTVHTMRQNNQPPHAASCPARLVQLFPREAVHREGRWVQAHLSLQGHSWAGVGGLGHLPLLPVGRAGYTCLPAREHTDERSAWAPHCMGSRNLAGPAGQERGKVGFPREGVGRPLAHRSSVPCTPPWRGSCSCCHGSLHR